MAGSEFEEQLKRAAQQAEVNRQRAQMEQFEQERRRQAELDEATTRYQREKRAREELLGGVITEVQRALPHVQVNRFLDDIETVETKYRGSRTLTIPGSGEVWKTLEGGASYEHGMVKANGYILEHNGQMTFVGYTTDPGHQMFDSSYSTGWHMTRYGVSAVEVSWGGEKRLTNIHDQHFGEEITDHAAMRRGMQEGLIRRIRGN